MAEGKKPQLQFRFVFLSKVSFDPCLCPFQKFVRVRISLVHFEGGSVTVSQQRDACRLLGRGSNRRTCPQEKDALSVSCTECFDGFRFWACLYSVCLPSFNVSRHVLLFGSGGSSHTVHANSV
jgi:hypothetical protein